MIDGAVLAKILTVFGLGLISPGPDFMMVSTMSLTRGRACGVKTAAGIASVITLYTALSLTGLSALLAQHALLAVGVKVCGGLYLLYLGAGLAWAAAHPAAETAPVAGPGPGSAYWAGVSTCLTNPKAIAFFTSIFAAAMTPGTDWAAKAVIVGLCTALCFGWFAFVAVGLSQERVRLGYRRARRWIDGLAGAALLAFGGHLLGGLAG